MTPLVVDGLNDLLRVVNIAGGLVGLALVSSSVWQRRATISRSSLMLRFAIAALLLATGWGSVELLASASPTPGIRPWLISIAVLWTDAAFILEAVDRRTEPKGP